MLDPGNGGGIGHAEKHGVGAKNQLFIAEGEAEDADARADDREAAGVRGRGGGRGFLNGIGLGGDLGSQLLPGTGMVLLAGKTIGGEGHGVVKRWGSFKRQDEQKNAEKVRRSHNDQMAAGLQISE